jgi:WhiB family redox-sensing transcriptional regulator
MGHLDNLDWRLRGPCTSLKPNEYDEIFFPEQGRRIKKAREFCAECPVKDICLEFALKYNCSGIWAGTNERERSKMKQVLTRTVVEPVLAAVAPIRKKRRPVRVCNIKAI